MMNENVNELGKCSPRNILSDSSSSRLSDRSRSAKCSPGLRRRRNAGAHCSPKGRLRLIQFLQEIDLDKALHSLSDECTFEDLLCAPSESIESTFSETLTSEEFARLWTNLQTCRSEKQLSQSQDRRVSPSKYLCEYGFTFLCMSLE